MKTFPATWNRAMVSATRFLMNSISSSRMIWTQTQTQFCSRAPVGVSCCSVVRTVKTVADTAYTSSACPLSALSSAFISSFASFGSLGDVSLPYSRWSM